MKIFLAALAIAGSAILSRAQDWTGAVSSDWNNPSNWSSAPQNGDDITISFANYTGVMAHPVISDNSIFSPAGVTIDGGAVLTVTANLTTTDRVEIIGPGTQIILNDGIVNVSGGAGNARLIFSEGAHFEMNGGQLFVGQRLLFELGASGEMNGGEIEIAETFALVDGNVTASSSFIQNGGFIATDDFGFENEAGNYFPSYVLNNGTITITTSFLVEGVAPGSGRGIFSASNGVLNVFGSLGNLAGSTTAFTIDIGASAVMNLNTTTIDQMAGDSIIVNNGGVINLMTNAVWQNEGVLSGENAIVNCNGNIVLNGTGTYQFPTLNIPITHSLIQESQLILVNGDFNLFGTYNQGSNSLEWNGENVQHFNTSTATILSNLLMNNSGDGVEINHDLTITESLTWQDGLLNATAGELIFQNNATSISASEVSFATVPISKIGSQAFVFPIGSAPSRFRALEISAPTAPGTIIRVEYEPTGFSNLVPVDVPLQSVSALEYWGISRSGSTDLVSVSVYWNEAIESGLSDCGSTTLALWNTSVWSFIPTNITGLCSGNGAGVASSVSPLPQYGMLTFGFTEGVFQQHIEVCNGATFQVGPNVYDTTGVYFDLFQDVNGEDSLVVTSLNILPAMDVSVSVNDFSLSANQTGATYQWLNCETGFAVIPNAVSQTYYPTENGSYAVIVTVNGCSDTSECILVDQLSVVEVQPEFLFYPNPIAAGDVITLQSNVIISRVNAYSADGKQLASFSANSQIVEIPTEQMRFGIVLIDVITSTDRVSRHKIVLH